MNYPTAIVARPLFVTVVVAPHGEEDGEPKQLPLWDKLLPILRGHWLGRVVMRDGMPSVRYLRGDDASQWRAGLKWAAEIEVIMTEGHSLDDLLDGVDSELEPHGLRVLDVLEREKRRAPKLGADQ